MERGSSTRASLGSCVQFLSTGRQAAELDCTVLTLTNLRPFATKARGIGVVGLSTFFFCVKRVKSQELSDPHTREL